MRMVEFKKLTGHRTSCYESPLGLQTEAGFRLSTVRP
jgi:hypothetical protein